MGLRRRSGITVDRLVDPLQVLEQDRLMISELRVLRLDLQRSLETLERFLVAPFRLERVPHLFEDSPAKHPRLVERSIQDQRVVQRIARLLEIRNRLLVSTEVVEGVSEVVPEDLVAAIQLDRLLVGRNGLLEPVDPVERVALVVPGLLVRWVDRERLLIAGERFLVNPE